ncbi:MAG: agmatinase [Candidatus Omnitrophica bacterium]|nr:agmatinase [Candidatus Omnitrophota bacterium]
MKNGNFAGVGESFADKDSSEIVVLPIPYDKTSTWIKGADKGPFALIEASIALEWYDIETDFEVYKKGIHTAKALTLDVEPKVMVAKVRAKVEEFLETGKFVVTLGGEHSVSIGAAMAHSEKFKDLCVLQLDAHSDLREVYDGSRYNHACVAARIKETSSVVQAGIRSMSIEEKGKLPAENVFFAKDITSQTKSTEKIISRLNDNVYVTIDLDVFDPGCMSSTGTPEPGGLLWYDVMEILRRVSEKRNVVGFDVVELCPNQANKTPDFLAAKLVYKFLSYIFVPTSNCTS